MSDGLTDIARDEDRARAYQQYLTALLHYLDNATDHLRLQRVLDAAQACDAIPRGYWQGKTALVQAFPVHSRQLFAGDRHAWERLLRAVEEDIALFRDCTRIRAKLHPSHNSPIADAHRTLANQLSILAWDEEKQDIAIMPLVRAAAQMFANFEAQIRQELEQKTPAL